MEVMAQIVAKLPPYPRPLPATEPTILYPDKPWLKFWFSRLP
jgi:hypothetical protein